MNRVEEELALVRTAFPAAELDPHDEVNWVRIPAYPLPPGVYQEGEELELLAFRIPAQAAEAPYGFWVHPGLELSSGQPLGNYTYSTETPWGNDWGQFSWSPEGPWVPKTEIRSGANMLDFVRSFTVRLEEAA
jgi:Prokaryotic E2 family E